MSTGKDVTYEFNKAVRELDECTKNSPKGNSEKTPWKLNVPTVKERMEAFEQFALEQRKILLGKGHDYTAGKDDEDAYTNFRVIADLLEGAPITAYTICMIYFLKHVFSLITFTKRGKQESGEGLRGRHLDVADYAFILDQLVPDHMEHFRKEVKEESRNEWVPEPTLAKHFPGPKPGDAVITNITE